MKDKLKLQGLYRAGELRRRLNKALQECWYITAIARQNAWQYEKLRKTRYADIITAIKLLLEN
ncbi:MAG TPA: hypothetical protein PLC04_04150 [Candidatus Kapabacteria bacterium]|nr:hypothetical protein [Candidatus Kapabacteria bacterium]